ncbi:MULTISPECIES: UDP-N-acetylmuramoyl-tripeptide--D-alanyl-D-alanine ligase [Deefgea]|uniref:UDP-N-acetylmuramoyl-tripeptide--D-alanyl-D-alanine ligase n=1 Tax=Deefgea chitinilytica TaxID=570276 RepID=A0ABS2CDG8_9NEIS|nr:MULTISPECIES: UDP-N-acetylmuramoyl-tripeptide--D-alanyl-D-alanine ligase [Deefgea]MBM5572188.1 UDP-N-acetylmuramoyl-tripeptide--D-alanyl-D-alanine ligase [Deefgea chitinilytica]MBM9889423.1 UDP-N-acetylmuramoyl-tripeptide--D-alanyl-D-alanine ligase [Deefgea sp. CFH1-16]
MLNLQETAQALGAKLQGKPELVFTRVTTDSRDIRSGDLFVALKGERFDAHDFVAQAFAQGAVAVMVERAMDGDCIIVDDTLQALGLLAGYWRAKHANQPLVAITGSNGKTSLKEMLAAIFAAHVGNPDLVHATKGNLNNHIGLPLTLLGIRSEHRFVVAEMGMNHFGEIDYLTHIARPDVAVVNNAGAAHLEALGSVAGVAKAKGEIFAGLVHDGVAIINSDDDFAGLWRGLSASHAQISFGLQDAEITAEQIELHAAGSTFKLATPLGTANVSLAVPGLHNVRNALAAAASAIALQIPLADIAKGLSAWGGVKGRLQAKQAANGAKVLDDTYNANPDSMRAAIDVLSAIGQSTRQNTVLVIGDMGEVGEDAAERHAEIGAYAREQGISALLATGEQMTHAVNAFGEGAQHFANKADLLRALNELLTPQSQVLVKGSRFMRMEEIVNALEGVQPCC